MCFGSKILSITTLFVLCAVQAELNSTDAANNIFQWLLYMWAVFFPELQNTQIYSLVELW